MRRYWKVRGGTGRYKKGWEDIGRYGKVQEGKRRYWKVREGTGKCGKV